MTQAELYKELKAITGRAAYLKFSKPQELPFIIYALPHDKTLYADNKRHYSIKSGWIELYMTSIDFELMGAVESLFSKNKLPWEKEAEDYTDDEQAVFFARWNFQLI